MSRTIHTRAHRGLVPTLLAITALALAACADDTGSETEATSEAPDASAAESADGSSAAPAAGGELTVGGANFNEMIIMQEMYGALLEDAGYTVEIISSESRELYAQSLIDGQLDVVPEYAATMAEYLNREVNGPDAAPIATSDATETVEAMRPIAEELGLVVLDPAEAVDQNGFAVLTSFADENGLESLSDLGALGEPVVLAATPECGERPFCQPGLEATYGLTITEVLPLGFGSPQAKQAVVDGQADLVLTGTTDATLEDLGLVLLEDDLGLQQADNLVPVLNAETATDQTVADVLNGLASVLTTEDLTELNRQVDAERQLPADAARAYLVDKGLISG